MFHFLSHFNDCIIDNYDHQNYSDYSIEEEEDDQFSSTFQIPGDSVPVDQNHFRTFVPIPAQSANIRRDKDAALQSVGGTGGVSEWQVAARKAQRNRKKEHEIYSGRGSFWVQLNALFIKQFLLSWNRKFMSFSLYILCSIGILLGCYTISMENIMNPPYRLTNDTNGFLILGTCC